MPVLELARRREVPVRGGTRVDSTLISRTPGQPDATTHMQVGPFPATEFTSGVTGLENVKPPTVTEARPLTARQRLGMRIAKATFALGGLTSLEVAIAACGAGAPSSYSSPSEQPQVIHGTPSAEKPTSKMQTQEAPTVQAPTPEAAKTGQLPKGPYDAEPDCTNPTPDAIDGRPFEESKPITVHPTTGPNHAAFFMTDRNKIAKREVLSVTTPDGVTTKMGGNDTGYVLVVKDGGQAVVEGKASFTECFEGNGPQLKDEEDSRQADISSHGFDPVPVYEIDANNKLTEVS